MDKWQDVVARVLERAGTALLVVALILAVLAAVAGCTVQVPGPVELRPSGSYSSKPLPPLDVPPVCPPSASSPKTHPAKHSFRRAAVIGDCQGG